MITYLMNTLTKADE